jgi:hypothetical protein
VSGRAKHEQRDADIQNGDRQTCYNHGMF